MRTGEQWGSAQQAEPPAVHAHGVLLALVGSSSGPTPLFVPGSTVKLVTRGV
jgi:hypothetical protein